jgi:hypothetical protein
MSDDKKIDQGDVVGIAVTLNEGKVTGADFLREGDLHHEDCPQHPKNRAASAGHGPAQVANAAYRNGYDSIFGKRMPTGQA